MKLENLITYQKLTPFHYARSGLDKDEKGLYEERLKKRHIQLPDKSTDRGWAVRK
jgi:hypothetical protein